MKLLALPSHRKGEGLDDEGRGQVPSGLQMVKFQIANLRSEICGSERSEEAPSARRLVPRGRVLAEDL